VALSEARELDALDAVMLESCGVVKRHRMKDRNDVVKRMREALRKPPGASLGPLFFYSDGEGELAGVALRDLMLDNRVAIRRIAVSYVEQLLKSPESMTAAGALAFRKHKAKVLSMRATEWRRPAVETVTALDDDWLLNLAGVRQTLGTSLNEQFGEYLDAVLRPSVVALNGCSPAVLTPGVHADAIRAKLKELGGSSDGLAERVRSFVGDLSHLPLRGTQSLRAILKPAPSTADVDEVQAALKAESPIGSPMRSFYLCQVALSLDSDVEGRRHDVAKGFWDAVLPSSRTANPTVGQQGWQLASQLATFYIQHIETTVPAGHGEAVAAAAWWMTARVVGVLENRLSNTINFMSQVDQVYADPAAGVWDLVAPPMTPSALRYLTIHGPSPWALTLLEAVKSPEQCRWLLAAPGAGTLDERVGILAAAAATLAPVALIDPQEMFSFVTGVRRVVGWLASEEADESRKVALTGWAQAFDWAATGSLKEALADIETRDAVVQQWTCASIHQRISVDEGRADELWTLVSSSQWKDHVWHKLDPLCMQAIAYALLESAVAQRPDWWPLVGHLFVDFAEERPKTRADDQAIFLLVVKACTMLGASSPMRRLLRGSRGSAFRPLVDQVRARLEQILPRVSGWAGARMRALFVDML